MTLTKQPRKPGAPALPRTISSLETIAVAGPGLSTLCPRFADQIQSRHFQVIANPKVGAQFHVGFVIYGEGRPFG